MKPTHDTPLEPQLGKNEWLDEDGNVRKDNDLKHQNLEDVERGNPFDL